MATVLVNCQTPSCAECASLEEVTSGKRGALSGPWWHCEKCVKIMDDMMREESDD